MMNALMWGDVIVQDHDREKAAMSMWKWKAHCAVQRGDKPPPKPTQYAVAKRIESVETKCVHCGSDITRSAGAIHDALRDGRGGCCCKTCKHKISGRGISAAAKRKK